MNFHPTNLYEITIAIVLGYSVFAVFFGLPEVLCGKRYKDQDFSELFKPMECPQGIHKDYIDRCLSDCWSEHAGEPIKAE
jgi:hypothetical protein